MPEAAPGAASGWAPQDLFERRQNMMNHDENMVEHGKTKAKPWRIDVILERIMRDPAAIQGSELPRWRDVPRISAKFKASFTKKDEDNQWERMKNVTIN